MRFTIGRKLNALLVGLLLVSIGGVVGLATRLFTDDLTGLLRKGTLDAASLLAGRVRAEMKHVADRARTLGTASLEDFRYPEDRLKFIQDNLAVDAQTVALSLHRWETPDSAQAAAGFRPAWRIVHPKAKEKHGIESAALDALDAAFPLDLATVARGEVEFAIGRLEDGTPVLRMGIPFVQRPDGTFSQVIAVDLQQERLSSLFSEATTYLTYLVDARGRVLGSTDPARLPLGEDVSALAIVQAMARSQGASGQADFPDRSGESQIGAFHRVGFAGLAVVSQVPLAVARSAETLLYRRTGFMAGAFLFLALALGFVFSQGVTRPVARLAAAAGRVKVGDFKVRLQARMRRKKGGAPGDLEPAPGDEIQEFSVTFNEMVRGLEERDKVKGAFEKFHSKEMAEKVLSGELKLGGERKEATVFFSDVRGFTAMSETVEAEVLVKILNRYMTRMVRVIHDQGGIVDKYVGDAIMAVWGAPVAREGDVERAVHACLGMRQALADLNEELKGEGLPALKIGMGLNHGPLVSGNIGSEERMEFTVIGDTVNTASRIESLTKSFGTDLLISQAVLDQVPGKFVVEKAHEARVKGKHDALIVYKVHGFVDASGAEILIQTAYSAYAAEKSDKVIDAGPSAGESTKLIEHTAEPTKTMEIAAAPERAPEPLPAPEPEPTPEPAPAPAPRTGGSAAIEAFLAEGLDLPRRDLPFDAFTEELARACSRLFGGAPARFVRGGDAGAPEGPALTIEVRVGAGSWARILVEAAGGDAERALAQRAADWVSMIAEARCRIAAAAGVRAADLPAESPLVDRPPPEASESRPEAA